MFESLIRTFFFALDFLLVARNAGRVGVYMFQLKLFFGWLMMLMMMMILLCVRLCIERRKREKNTLTS